MLTAVSYTHLDVYKRQPSGSGQAAGAGSSATAVWNWAGEGEKDEGDTEKDPLRIPETGREAAIESEETGAKRKMEA